MTILPRSIKYEYHHPAFFYGNNNNKHKARCYGPIWIDLDNSPHVPFFHPIITGLKSEGMAVCITARDAYQVHELVALHKINCKSVGRHYGKNKLMKGIGLVIRSMQLLGYAMTLKPRVAVSHGSRAQIMVARILGIPSILIADYEHVFHIAKPDFLVTPDIIPNDDKRNRASQLITYPGLKEHVYVGQFRPDPSFPTQYNLLAEEIIITLRPPACEAHYHNTEGDVLFDAVLKKLIQYDRVRLFILPRNSKQKKEIQEKWQHEINTGKIIIPHSALSGLDLIWYSDLVIGGGGTMNREAAALGVPVISIFKGQLGAVDRHLEQEGKLKLLHDIHDIDRVIIPQKREHLHAKLNDNDNVTLKTLLNIIRNIAKGIWIT